MQQCKTNIVVKFKSIRGLSYFQQTIGRAYRQTDGYTGIKTDRQIDGHTGIKTDRRIYKDRLKEQLRLR